LKPPPSNVAHSVRTRLLTFAKAEGEEFNYVLIRYALERFNAAWVTRTRTRTGRSRVRAARVARDGGKTCGAVRSDERRRA
jgi:hypothetical protein